jgi:CRP-like cAMP-binding protein
MTQRDLANNVGGSRESVNKHLQCLHRAGVIDLAKGSIVIRDRMALERLV